MPGLVCSVRNPQDWGMASDLRMFAESGVSVLARPCRNACANLGSFCNSGGFKIRDIPFGDGWSWKAKKAVREGQKKHEMILNSAVILIYTQY